MRHVKYFWIFSFCKIFPTRFYLYSISPWFSNGFFFLWRKPMFLFLSFSSTLNPSRVDSFTICLYICADLSCNEFFFPHPLSRRPAILFLPPPVWLSLFSFHLQKNPLAPGLIPFDRISRYWLHTVIQYSGTEEPEKTTLSNTFQNETFHHHFPKMKFT